MTVLANRMFSPEGFFANIFYTKSDRKAVDDYSRRLTQTLRAFERKDQMDQQDLV